VFQQVCDGEEFRVDFVEQRERVSSEKGLELYLLAFKSKLEEGNFKEIISEDDKKCIMIECDETLKWVEADQVSIFVGCCSLKWLSFLLEVFMI
jgi:hypothetical protein